MRIGWNRRAQRKQNVDLARRVVDMVVASDDVADAHVPVVHDNAEVVGRHAVAAHDDQIVEFAVGDRNRPLDHVVEGDHPVLRRPEADHRSDTIRRLRQGFSGFRPPASVVTRFVAARLLRFAHDVEFFLAGIAIIGVAFLQQLIDHFLVPLHALHLVIRTLVPVEAEPGHAVKNGLHGSLGGAFLVGVLDAQNEFAAHLAGVSPGKQRGARAADMQIAGGRGGETGADHDLGGRTKGGDFTRATA